MKTYQPTMKVPMSGLAGLAALVLAGGVLVGGALGFISNWFFIIFLYPILIGVVMGAVAAQGVRIGKVRNPVVAIIAAILAGFVAHWVFWLVGYQLFLGSASIDLVQQTGQAGFVGYILWIGQSGLPVLRVGQGAGFVPMGSVLTWIYLVAEIVVILFLVIPPARQQAERPFCETCQRWLGEPKLLGTLGVKRGEEILGYIQNGQFTRLGEELQRNPAMPNLGVFLASRGEECKEGEAFLVVKVQSRRKDNQNPLANGMIKEADARDLLQGIENRKNLYGTG